MHTSDTDTDAGQVEVIALDPAGWLVIDECQELFSDHCPPSLGSGHRVLNEQMIHVLNQGRELMRPAGLGG
jgi:hypothetical protein